MRRRMTDDVPAMLHTERWSLDFRVDTKFVSKRIADCWRPFHEFRRSDLWIFQVTSSPMSACFGTVQRMRKVMRTKRPRESGCDASTQYGTLFPTSDRNRALNTNDGVPPSHHRLHHSLGSHQDGHPQRCGRRHSQTHRGLRAM